jgi:aminoglycoside 3-N-acetyltransferase I
LAALSGSEVIGGLGAYELKKFEQERSELFIYDLAIHEDFRRRGVATALIEEAKSWALSRGIHLVFIQSEFDDVPASSTYEQFAEPLQANHFEFNPSSLKRDV